MNMDSNEVELFLILTKLNQIEPNWLLLAKKYVNTVPLRMLEIKTEYFKFLSTLQSMFKFAWYTN